MLLRHDVIDVKRHLGELFREMTILTPVLRARANRLVQELIHASAQAEARSESRALALMNSKVRPTLR